MAVVRRPAVLAGSTGTTLSLPTIVKAQADRPRGPIKLVVPFPPGGGAVGRRHEQERWLRAIKENNIKTD